MAKEEKIFVTISGAKLFASTTVSTTVSGTSGLMPQTTVREANSGAFREMPLPDGTKIRVLDRRIHEDALKAVKKR